MEKRYQGKLISIYDKEENAKVLHVREKEDESKDKEDKVEKSKEGKETDENHCADGVEEREEEEEDANGKEDLDNFQFFIYSGKALMHFLVVTLLLGCSAIVFMVLEEPEISSPLFNIINTTKSQYLMSEDERVKSKALCCSLEVNESSVWSNIDANYKATTQLPQELRKEIQLLLEETCMSAQTLMTPRGTTTNDNNRQMYYVFMKWFYFATTSATTIGYGQVYPKTDNGKIFYIFFSLIGIAMMMTLLKSCGVILSKLNNQLLVWIRHHVLRHRVKVSEEFMGMCSLVLLFIFMMLFVVWHDKNIGEAREWKIVETVYFWIVTFSTVGFGDVFFSLDVEVNHVYELLVCRVLGLVFLAAILDAIHQYLKSRRKLVLKKISVTSMEFTQNVKHKLMAKKMIARK